MRNTNRIGSFIFANLRVSPYRIVVLRSLVMGAAFLLLVGNCETISRAQTPRQTNASNGENNFGPRLNRLANESSPYLRMHARNPVDWYPWGPEALQKALRENKPIFLSIGYSTCFWCHVMERKVFENKEIAEYMNQHFVNIKVDREERPDLDDIYMTALQVYFQLAQSSQGGGWPLSIFLTPEGKPIAGGTYFPPEDAPGQTGFPTVLRQVHKAWQTREADVRATADIITREVVRLSQPPVTATPVPLKPELAQAAVQEILEDYDPEAGGFDFDPQAPEGPKFPQPCRLALIQAQIGRPTNRKVDAAALLDDTLIRMARGGIRDHLGGGFHRYSTDRHWRVPHFEKMLYDNAQLAEIYVDAYRRTGREIFREIAEETLAFVQNQLTGPQGQFYSALDAETDGVEGQYYVWSRRELQDLLSAGDFRIFAETYGISGEPQLESGYVLTMNRPLETVAEALGMPLGELRLRLREMRQTLLSARQKRPPLLRDEKVLTAWNGLMIRAYARAGQTFHRRDYLETAEKAALYLLAQHRDPSGGLLRTRSGKASASPAFLEDYAFFISGLLALYEATNEEKWLNAARRLTDDQNEAFWDSQRGGYFFSAHDQEVVLTRLKSASDGVLPSGNSVAARNLIQLAHLQSDDAARETARRTIAVFSSQLKDAPGSFPTLALALQEYLHWYGTPEPDAVGGKLFTGGISSPRPAPSPVGKEAPAMEFPKLDDVQVALVPSEEQAQQHPLIQARGLLSVSSLPRGGECQIAIEILIQSGWHLNANPPKPEFVIPLTVRLTGPEGAELKDIRYPAGQAFTLQGIDEQLQVYENRVIVTGTLALPEQTTSPADLTIEIDYQACNDRNCLPRKRLVISGPVPLTRPGADPKPINSSYFGR